MKLTAVIPTRGDVDVSPIVSHLRTYREIAEVVVVAGSTPFNRYMWGRHATTDLIYTQDDDCITDIAMLIDFWEDRDVILNAMTREHAAQYPGAQTLLGFGAIFPRLLINTTFIFDERWKRDALFFREADRIFATVNTHSTVYPKIEILPHANNPNRLWKQADHLAARAEMNERIFLQTGIRAGCL